VVDVVDAVTVNARIRCTLVNVSITKRSCISWPANAHIAIDVVLTFTMNAWRRLTFVNVGLTVYSSPAWNTDALVEILIIDAVSVKARS
jgi:hypothetical protein